MSTSEQQVLTAKTPEFIYNEPPVHLRGAKMLLLTIGGCSVVGNWYGSQGQYFAGYAPLPRVDKAAFQQALARR